MKSIFELGIETFYKSLRLFVGKGCLCLLNCFGQMNEILLRDCLYDKVVEVILLGLYQLNSLLESLNLVNYQQRTFIIVIILFLPEISILIVVKFSILIEFIQVLVFILTSFFILLKFNLVDSVISIFLYQFH